MKNDEIDFKELLALLETNQGIKRADLRNYFDGVAKEYKNNQEFQSYLDNNAEEILQRVGFNCDGASVSCYQNSDDIVYMVIPTDNNSELNDEALGDLSAAKADQSAGTVLCAGSVSTASTYATATWISTLGSASTAGSLGSASSFGPGHDNDNASTETAIGTENNP